MKRFFKVTAIVYLLVFIVGGIVVHGVYSHEQEFGQTDAANKLFLTSAMVVLSMIVGLLSVVFAMLVVKSWRAWQRFLSTLTPQERREAVRQAWIAVLTACIVGDAWSEHRRHERHERNEREAQEGYQRYMLAKSLGQKPIEFGPRDGVNYKG